MSWAEVKKTIYDVNTSAVTKASGSRGAQSAERIGGGAGLGKLPWAAGAEYNLQRLFERG